MRLALTGTLSPELEITAYNRDERFAAAFLGTTVETMRTWRKRRRAPPYRKLNGLIRYSLAELKSWVESQPVGGRAA